MSNVEEDIKRRTEFYNSPDVARLLSKEGVPKSKKAMISFIAKGAFGGADKDVDSKSFDCLSYVIFSVHPQQINIRDKANGKIISIIRR